MNTDASYNSILGNFAKHVDLDEREKEGLLKSLEIKQFKNKEVIVKQGSVCRELFYVIEGCLRIFHTDESGREHTLCFFPEDWWPTDIASFYSQTRAINSIDAVEDSKVFSISLDRLEKLYETSPSFERFFRILTQNGFVFYQRRMASALFSPAVTRYHNFKRLFPTLENRVSKKYIASYLGITPEFLSLLRKNEASGTTS